MPLHGLRAHRRAARRRAPGQPGRGGDEVPLRRGRLHHGAALLQAAEQRRHARGPPLDEHRASSSPRSQFTDETASGWQEAALPVPVPITQGHHLHHLVPLEPGTVRLQPRLLLRGGRRPRAAARSGRRLAGGNGVYHYGASALPRLDLQRHQLLGRRRASSRLPPADTRAPHVSSVSPPAGATGVPPASDGHGHLRRAARPAHRERRVVHARRRHGRRRGRRQVTYDADDPQGDPHAVSAARARQDLHGDRQERHRRRHRPRRQPARRRTRRGRSARRRSVRAPSSRQRRARRATR